MASFIKNGNKSNPPELAANVVKIVVIGEPRCGKTTFIRSHYDSNIPRGIYSDNGVRIYPCYFKSCNRLRKVSMFEIPGHPGFYPEQRIPHYEKADIIVFMYAIDDPMSLQMLVSKWIPEAKPAIDTYKLPVVYIGTKKDLREDQQVIDRLALQNQIPVTMQQGSELLPHVSNYFAIKECSINDLDEIQSAFRMIFILVATTKVYTNG